MVSRRRNVPENDKDLREVAVEVDCDKCINQGNDEICDECSALEGECCSCHINPPCSYCVNLRFEEK